IVNDLISGRIVLDDVSLLVVDEAHRTVGEYAYVFVGERYALRPDGLVLATTASPGSDMAKILEVCKNLVIEHVEIRSKYDADVLNYVHELDMRWESLELPEDFGGIISLLKEVMGNMVKELRSFGIFLPSPVSTRSLLACGEEIRGKIRADPRTSSLYRAAVVQAAAVKINHAVELAETQGLGALRGYMKRLLEESGSRRGSKASRMLANNPKVGQATSLLADAEGEHPKIGRVLDIVGKELEGNEDSRVIVFTHYRETSEIITERLGSVLGVRPVRFVGQASRGDDKGLRQKEQVRVLQSFRDGEYNVLVATSVAEEGLDIPSTDLVVFYEPVPSEIRTIQRRGRTGRKRKGKVIILMAKDTRDQGYYFSSLRKEKLMRQELQTLRRDLAQHMSVGDIYQARVVDATEAGAEDVKDRTEGKKRVERAGRIEGLEHGGKRQRTLSDFSGGAHEGAARRGRGAQKGKEKKGGRAQEGAREGAVGGRYRENEGDGKRAVEEGTKEERGGLMGNGRRDNAEEG
ncbi:MAG: hypothetical protein KAT70_06275, partial [Thermoplasmata archaeon]|nr:hypothetical protein [Thermoplasmata archaeon]